MSSTAKTLVIEADGAYEIRDIPMSYPECNEALLDGGFMQHMHCPSFVFIMDEEGNYKDHLTDNLFATALWYELGGAQLLPGDRFRGRVGIAGTAGENIVDVPDVSDALSRVQQQFAQIGDNNE